MISSRPLHLLVADDNQLDRALIAAYISSLGWSAIYVSDGDAAVRVAASEAFDAFVFDQNMPGRTGVDAVAAIRATHDANAGAPALIWTAGDIATVSAAAGGVASVDVVRKPMSRGQLLTWATKYLGGNLRMVDFEPAQRRVSSA